MPSSSFLKKILFFPVSFSFIALLAPMPSAVAQTVEEGLRDNTAQFLFPLHGKSTPQPARAQPADSGSVSDGDQGTAGTVTQGANSATITNNEGASETVTQNPNDPNGTIVRGKNGQVVAFVDSASSPGRNRISDPSGNVLGTIIKENQQGGYQVLDQYGKPLGSLDDAGAVYNFYGQQIGTVPPGGSAADLFAAWSLIKQN